MPPLRAQRLLVFAAAVLAFAPTLRNDFINLDDDRIILAQDFLRAPTSENLSRLLSPLPAREEWLPVRDLTYMANFAIDDGPIGFALGNLLLHGIGAVLVLGLARRVLGCGRGQEPGRDDRDRPFAEAGALGAALFFALHPIHAESVAWLSGRKDVLSGAFWVLALSAYLDFLRAETHRERLALWTGSLLATVLALLSKPTATSLPIALGLADLVLGAPGRRLRARAASLAPHALATGAFVAGYLHLLRAWAAENAPVLKSGPGALATLYTDAAVIAQYLARLLLPLDQRLFSEQGARAALDLEVAIGLGVLGAALAATALLLARRPRAGFGAALFFAALLPCMGFVAHGIPYAERYLYLPSIGFAIVAGYGLARAAARLEGRGRAALAAGFAVYLAFAGTRAAQLATVFQSSETLWVHVLRREPENTIALGNLAMAEFERHPARAEELLRRVVALRPGQAKAYYNLGLLAERGGRLGEALERYRTASRIDARYVRPLYGAASVLEKQGRPDLALLLYEAIVREWPIDKARAARVALARLRAGAAHGTP